MKSDWCTITSKTILPLILIVQTTWGSWRLPLHSLQANVSEKRIFVFPIVSNAIYREAIIAAWQNLLISVISTPVWNMKIVILTAFGLFKAENWKFKSYIIVRFELYERSLFIGWLARGYAPSWLSSRKHQGLGCMLHLVAHYCRGAVGGPTGKFYPNYINASCCFDCYLSIFN